MNVSLNCRAPVQFFARTTSPRCRGAILFSTWTDAARLLADRSTAMQGVVALQSVGRLRAFLQRPGVVPITCGHDPDYGAMLMVALSPAEAYRWIAREDPALTDHLTVLPSPDDAVFWAHCALATLLPTLRGSPRALLHKPLIFADRVTTTALLYCDHHPPLRWRGHLTPFGDGRHPVTIS